MQTSPTRIWLARSLILLFYCRNKDCIARMGKKMSSVFLQEA